MSCSGLCTKVEVIVQGLKSCRSCSHINSLTALTVFNSTSTTFHMAQNFFSSNKTSFEMIPKWIQLSPVRQAGSTGGAEIWLRLWLWLAACLSWDQFPVSLYLSVVPTLYSTQSTVCYVIRLCLSYCIVTACLSTPS